MPQISLYIDKETLKKVEAAAQNEHTSISGWVRKRIRTSLANEWPENYFELFGSLQDADDFEPKQDLPFDFDAEREAL